MESVALNTTVGNPGRRALRILSAVLTVAFWMTLQPRANAEDQRPDDVPGDSGPDLSGVWKLTVEDLSIWAPPYTLAKATGRIHWRFETAGGALSVHECDAGSEDRCRKDGGPSGGTFEKVEVREVIVRDDFIAFKVPGAAGAYEAYWLERFSDDRISGTYTVYDRYGGGPRSGPEYRARLTLQKVD